MRALLDADQAAEYLHMSRRQVLRLARLGCLEGSKPGQVWLFTEKQLNDYVDRRSNSRKVHRPVAGGGFARTARSAGYHKKQECEGVKGR